jgi:thiamine biosynthesis lipoprotein
MSFKKDIALFLTLGTILIALTFFVDSKNKKTYCVTWNAMGTVAQITGERKSEVEFAERKAKELFTSYDLLLSTWRNDSELSKISKKAGTQETLTISPDVTNVYKYAFDIMKQSKGAFNPLIGNVMKLWGFNGSKKTYRLPDKEEIESLPFSIDDVYFNAREIRLEKKGMSLDLGGIAKGEAIERLAGKIKTEFPRSKIMINLGGNIKVLGSGTRTIGVRNPFKEGYVAILELKDGEAVATSGDYERFIEINGIKYAHIFDGRTGCPATNNIASVSVIANSATIADALSTTLYVLGPEEGEKFLNDFYPDVSALWISTSNVWTPSKRMKTRYRRIQ